MPAGAIILDIVSVIGHWPGCAALLNRMATMDSHGAEKQTHRLMRLPIGIGN